MVKDIATQLNWLDIVALIIIIRTTYIGFVKGFSVEIFKFPRIEEALGNVITIQDTILVEIIRCE